MKLTIPSFVCLLYICCFAVLSAGCGRGDIALPEVSDADQARQMLQTALEEWKNGTTIYAMREKQPAIHVADEQWLSGGKLRDFAIQGNGQTKGMSIRFDVTLQVANSPAGAWQKRSVRYTVATDPVVSVVRDDT